MALSEYRRISLQKISSHTGTTSRMCHDRDGNPVRGDQSHQPPPLYLANKLADGIEDRMGGA
jgi:hypothetical protein